MFNINNEINEEYKWIKMKESQLIQKNKQVRDEVVYYLTNKDSQILGELKNTDINGNQWFFIYNKSKYIISNMSFSEAKEIAYDYYINNKKEG